jgi:soluble lytic murein transglycosylase-like protein
MAKRPTKKQQEARTRLQQRRRIALGAVGGLLLLLVLVGLLRPEMLETVLPGSGQSQRITNPNAPLAEFYADEVLYWRDDIRRWAKQYDVNPNVIAIVMQIESCGAPNVMSSAGALGLMQVMPFHFENGENMLNPDTNMRNGMDVFYECLTQFADWNLGVALACYNGGPSVTQRDFSTWPQETQNYFRWATGIWNDVIQGNKTSETVEEWLAAGGQGLCTRASQMLFNTSETASSSGAP